MTNIVAEKVPEELHRKMKVYAAQRGLTLRQALINLMEAATVETSIAPLDTEGEGKKDDK